ncbi:adenine deaminase C-terminal domain-containing protein [Candidatus Bipolaricaulota sp. J31]
MRELDLLLRGGRVLDVYRLRIFPGWVGIAGGRFIYVEEGEPPRDLVAREVHDLRGGLIVPGLIDAHMHVESSLLSPHRFAAAVLPHGTTCVLADPHEIANVAGKEGVRWFWEVTRGLPLRVYLAIPSSVPPTEVPLETPNANLSVEDVTELLELPDAIALGEVMDYRGLVRGAEKYSAEIAAARRARCTVEGHVPALSGTELSAYISHGIHSDHTLMSPDKIVEEITKGVTVMLQEKSLTPEVIKALKSLPDRSRCLLVTDDVPPSKLMQGHLSRVLLQAVELGLPPEEAFAMATARPAAYLGLRHLGAIAPGREADFLVMEDLTAFPPCAVYVRGQKVAEEGELVIQIPSYTSVPPACPPIPGPFAPGDFALPVEGEVEANIVAVLNRENSLTGLVRGTVTVRGGFPVHPRGLAVVGVFARRGEGRCLGLLQGLGLEEGAIATSFAHDSHNLLVVGCSPADMAAAANVVHRHGGGIAVVQGGNLLAFLQLPLLGLLADACPGEVAASLQRIEDALRELGVVHKRPFLLVSVLSLTVSPYYKFSDKGIVDVENLTIIPPLYPS